MTTCVSRKTVEAFLQAFALRDPGRLGPLLHEDVVWATIGPVERLRFCGHYRGKAMVLDVFRRVAPTVMRLTRYEPEIVLVDGDRAAVFARISGVTPSGRAVSYRSTHFIRFEDDKVIEFRAVIDSYDAAEQIIGRPLDAAGEDARPAYVGKGNLVAV